MDDYLMDDLTRKRLEYNNILVKAAIEDNTETVSEYTALIIDLDNAVSKHLNCYWSDIKLKYVSE